MESQSPPGAVVLPRVAITYCTQCRWMLRAAYFGQELLSTFGTTIGEIALIPATGGLFTVDVTYRPSQTDGVEPDSAPATQVRIWDRKADGGFPEAKILKQKLRNLIEPDRKLGHSDTPSSKVVDASAAEPTDSQQPSNGATADGASNCEDCK